MRKLLGARADAMPRMHESLIQEKYTVRVAVQQEKLKQWEDFRNSVGPSIIDAIELHVRAGEEKAVAALNYLEDHELADDAHRTIHRAAFVRRGFFGCPVTLDDDHLWTGCAFRLSHLRYGMSAGMTAKFVCSICGTPVETCVDHQPGQLYDTLATRADDGRCSVCAETDCGHVMGTVYPSTAHGRGTHMDVHEVSLVPRPRYPLARITAMTWNLPDRDEQALARWGARLGLLNCNCCYGPCAGFSTEP